MHQHLLLRELLLPDLPLPLLPPLLLGVSCLLSLQGGQLLPLLLQAALLLLLHQRAGPRRLPGQGGAGGGALAQGVPLLLDETVLLDHHGLGGRRHGERRVTPTNALNRCVRRLSYLQGAEQEVQVGDAVEELLWERRRQRVTRVQKPPSESLLVHPFQTRVHECDILSSQRRSPETQPFLCLRRSHRRRLHNGVSGSGAVNSLRLHGLSDPERAAHTVTEL